MRYDRTVTNIQQDFIQFVKELKKDDLLTRMSDIVKRSGWNRQFKSHDKINKRLMTRAETTERDVNNREQTAAQETRQKANIVLETSLVTGPISLTGSPPSPPNVESVPDTLPRGSAVAAVVTTVVIVTTTTTTVGWSEAPCQISVQLRILHFYPSKLQLLTTPPPQVRINSKMAIPCAVD